MFPRSPIHLPDPPPVNERGERVLAAGRGQPAGAVAADFALVLATDLERILLVRNASRQVLELPGGWLDAGESARQTAARELTEETGYTATGLEVEGWLQLHSPRHRAPLGGIVFRAHGLRRRHPHAPDQEIDSLHWARLDALPRGISAIDAWLIDQFGRQ